MWKTVPGVSSTARGRRFLIINELISFLISFFRHLPRRRLVIYLSLYWKDWHVAGILKIKDILDDNSKFV